MSTPPLDPVPPTGDPVRFELVRAGGALGLLALIVVLLVIGDVSTPLLIVFAVVGAVSLGQLLWSAVRLVRLRRGRG